MAAFISTLCAAGAAQAQARGFGVERFEPSERGSEWFTLDSLDLRGHLRPAAGGVASWAYRPFVLYDPDGSVRSAIVEHQIVVHLGGSLVLWDRLRLGANLPLQAYATGTSGTLAGVTYPAPSADQSIGDLRLSGDARLFGKYGDVITGALGLAVWLPTGSAGAYAGDGNVRLMPRAQVAGDVGDFAYAARLGFQYRDRTGTLGGAPIGSEFAYAASFGRRFLGRKLLVGPELYGSSVTAGGDFFGKRTSPIEAILGGHYSWGDLRAGAGVGAGLSRGFGSPTVRVIASLEWVPRPEAAPPVVGDRDGDGVPDDVDVCPDVPGVRSADPRLNGCPADRDRDGVPDNLDACPDVPGVRSDDRAKNGCPADRDGDGVPDQVDACPTQPGVKTDDPATNGCPPDNDRDKDGIPNAEDACPNQAGQRDQDPNKNGCPKAFVQGNVIKIVEPVKFKTGSAEILPGPDGESVLLGVLAVLNDHPEIKKVRVEGHTDNRGVPAKNKKLSAARAASVVKWLVGHGVDPARLASAGFGQELPVDTNATDEGRQNNRRVEFHIEEKP
ncbi:MAG TPA: OmpA family protein [Polyangiaceae bacterium]|nr:OmpA family protein [Polyangiaceae bacterium]